MLSTKADGIHMPFLLTPAQLKRLKDASFFRGSHTELTKFEKLVPNSLFTFNKLKSVTAPPSEFCFYTTLKSDF
jgi:hypothetical protein